MLNTEDHHHSASCKIDTGLRSQYRRKLPALFKSIVAHCEDPRCRHHIDYEPIPSRAAVIDILHRLRDVLFPGYFTSERLDPVNLDYHMGQSLSELFDLLSEQISLSIRHDCFRYSKACSGCVEQGYAKALELVEKIPEIRNVLATDVNAAYEGDPAARSSDEIIFSYPGMFALTIHRVAHEMHQLSVPLLPRIMSEYAHSETGIDIHPGAVIGRAFVIDHGTGVVIGETAVIGDNVRLYQGVTLGALSLPRNAGVRLKDKKRHPTIEDNVIIYAGATILGGETVIGAHSVVGGNVWLTTSVPPGTKVMMKAPELVYISQDRRTAAAPETAATGGSHGSL